MNVAQADVMAIPYASGTFQAVCFSPPYWGLRAYSTGNNKHAELGSEKLHDCLGWATGAPCGECFVCHTVAYMREVPEDILKECKEEIMQTLFEYAWSKVRRGVVAGLPEWYKEELLKNSF